MSLRYEPASVTTTPRRGCRSVGEVVGGGGLQLKNWGVVVTEAGSYLRLIDPCITHLKAQGPSRTCNKSKEDEEEEGRGQYNP